MAGTMPPHIKRGRLSVHIRHVVIGGIVASLGAALGFLWSRVGAQSGRIEQPAAS